MYTFVNWNNEIRFDVADSEPRKPNTIEEFQPLLVMEAHARNSRVKVTWSVHYITPCLVGSNIILSDKNMKNIISIDKQALIVTI